ncbi:uncharacterized protein LY89DRAFT_673067 [Mollisia scopiformis]|uniref:Uncharacterized protein n=1 Tax=Mollisia scopiformis TaxID=149040 RepID=A0A194WYC1_MOLSC|nr:uncharacterized protein LY89DRAFT_673067 [Mollisia scopiformis]KUJ12963.1 hypothetical protein LY89DRAFT_673067 [Mollisia scopiformis]
MSTKNLEKFVHTQQVLWRSKLTLVRRALRPFKKLCNYEQNYKFGDWSKLSCEFPNAFKDHGRPFNVEDWQLAHNRLLRAEHLMKAIDSRIKSIKEEPKLSAAASIKDTNTLEGDKSSGAVEFDSSDVDKAVKTHASTEVTEDSAVEKKSDVAKDRQSKVKNDEHSDEEPILPRKRKRAVVKFSEDEHKNQNATSGKKKKLMKGLASHDDMPEAEKPVAKGPAANRKPPKKRVMPSRFFSRY